MRLNSKKMMMKEGEYLFLYNSNRIEDKKAHGYVISLNKVKINDRDIHKDHLTAKQIAEVADELNVSVKELFAENTLGEYERYTDEDLVSILSQDPSKIKTPIILSPNNSFFVSSSYELIKEKIETHEINENMGNAYEK